MVVASGLIILFDISLTKCKNTNRMIPVVLQKIYEIASGKMTIYESFEDYTSSDIIDLYGNIVLNAVYAFSAAFLSYGYNKYIGNRTSLAIFWASLCFFFPTLYIPIYAFFLNPITRDRYFPFRIPIVLFEW